MFGKCSGFIRFMTFGASFSLLAMSLFGCAAGREETLRDTNLNRFFFFKQKTAYEIEW